MFAVAHRHLLVLLLAVAHHQHVRNLLQLRFADLQVDLFVAVVQRGANARRVQLLLDRPRILHLPVRNRQHRRLHRRQPQRKRPGVELDQVRNHPLHGADDGAMDHHRPVLLAVRAHVLQPELVGQVEIHLDRRVRFLVPHHVGQLDIQLRPVKRRLARRFHVRQPERIHGLAQHPFAQRPHLVVVDVLLLFALSRSDSR